MAKSKGGLKNLGIGEFQKSGLVKPLRGKRRRKEIRAAQKLQFGGVLRDLRGEKRASKMQESRIQDYFQQYKKGLTTQQQATAGAYREAQTQIAGQSQAAANYAEQLRQRLGAEAAADAARRGVATPTAGSETNVAAQLARMNAANILGGVTAAQGAAQRTYFQKAKGTAGREMIEQRLREQARRRSLGEELRDVKQQRGALGVDIMAQQRGQERDFYLGLLGIAGSRAGRRLQKTMQKSSQRHESKEAAKGRKFDRREAKKDRQAGRQEEKGQNQREREKERKQAWALARSAWSANPPKSEAEFKKFRLGLADKLDNPQLANRIANKMKKRFEKKTWGS